MKKIDILFFPFPDYMHGHFGGFTTWSAGRYRVIVDNRQPEDFQMRVLKHEYGHIMLGHVLSEDPEPEYPSPEFDAREAEADAYADAMTEAEFSALLSLSNQVHRNTLPECVPEVLPA